MSTDPSNSDNSDHILFEPISPDNQIDARKNKYGIRRRDTLIWNKEDKFAKDIKFFGPKAVYKENVPASSYLQRSNEYIEDPDGAIHLAWKEEPKGVLFIIKTSDKTVLVKAVEIISFVIFEKNLDVFMEFNSMKEVLREESNLAEKITSWDHSKINLVDFIICIGGDGTFLYATSLYINCSVPPIICFGMGSLGFLTHFDITLYQEAIDRVLNKHMSITLRSRLKAQILPPPNECFISSAPDKLSQKDDTSQKDVHPKILEKRKTRLIVSESGDMIEDTSKIKTSEFVCINEVTIDRGASPYLTQLEIYCNNFFITKAQADGLIIATPTGSTAYSLAAGASMVHPNTEAFIITPICPHSLSFRPIVIPNGVEVVVKADDSTRHIPWVSFDGRNRQQLQEGERIKINIDNNPVPCLNNTGHISDWFKSLVEGLNWNVRQGQKKL